MESWAIDLHKEYFKFSCAHFLIFPDGTKERLHGHNYHVQVQLSGQLSNRGLVMDFNHAKPIVRDLCDQLDEHWLAPGEHPELKITARDDGHTEVVYREDHYLVPSQELIVLPINNASAENFATWLGRELRSRLADRHGETHIDGLEVSVSETPGQRGVYRYSD